MMRSRAYAAVGAVALAASAAAGVLTAQIPGAQAYSERLPGFADLDRLIPSYPGSRFWPLGADLHVDGTERELGYALTDDPPDKVADRYEAIFISQGFNVRRQGNGDEIWVSANLANLEDPWIRTVAAAVAPQGTTIVASVSLAYGGEREPSVPLPALCAIVSSTGGRDGKVDTEILLMSCDATRRQIIDFYDQHLPGGDRSVHIGDDGKSEHVTYTAGQRSVMLTVTRTRAAPPRCAATLTWQEHR